jgi:hypothetical protein
MDKDDVVFNTEKFRHFTIEAATPGEALAKANARYMAGDDGESIEEGATECTGVTDLATGATVFPVQNRLEEQRDYWVEQYNNLAKKYRHLAEQAEAADDRLRRLVTDARAALNTETHMEGA